MFCSFHPRPILRCDLKPETGLTAAFFSPSFLELKKHKEVTVIETTESWMLCKQLFRFQKYQNLFVQTEFSQSCHHQFQIKGYKRTKRTKMDKLNRNGKNNYVNRPVSKRAWILLKSRVQARGKIPCSAWNGKRLCFMFSLTNWSIIQKIFCTVTDWNCILDLYDILWLWSPRSWTFLAVELLHPASLWTSPMMEWLFPEPVWP